MQKMNNKKIMKLLHVCLFGFFCWEKRNLLCFTILSGVLPPAAWTLDTDSDKQFPGPLIEKRTPFADWSLIDLISPWHLSASFAEPGETAIFCFPGGNVFLLRDFRGRSQITSLFRLSATQNCEWGDEFTMLRRRGDGAKRGLGLSPFMPVLTELHIFIQSQFTQHYAGLMATVLELILTASEPLLTYILNWSNAATSSFLGLRMLMCTFSAGTKKKKTTQALYWIWFPTIKIKSLHSNEKVNEESEHKYTWQGSNFNKPQWSFQWRTPSCFVRTFRPSVAAINQIIKRKLQNDGVKLSNTVCRVWAKAVCFAWRHIANMWQRPSPSVGPPCDLISKIYVQQLMVRDK